MVEHSRPDTLRISIDADLRDLIPGFLQNRRQDVCKLREAAAVGDFETIRTLGHRMRGDGGGYGFQMISEIGHALERAAIEKDTEDITIRVDELTLYLERIEVVYE